MTVGAGFPPARQNKTALVPSKLNIADVHMVIWAARWCVPPVCSRHTHSARIRKKAEVECGRREVRGTAGKDLQPEMFLFFDLQMVRFGAFCGILCVLNHRHPRSWEFEERDTSLLATVHFRSLEAADCRTACPATSHQPRLSLSSGNALKLSLFCAPSRPNCFSHTYIQQHRSVV